MQQHKPIQPEGVRLLSYQRRTDEGVTTVPIIRPVHLLRHPEALGFLPGTEEVKESGEVFHSACVFADKFPVFHDREGDAMAWGTVNLPECLPISVSTRLGEIVYGVDHFGSPRFDEAMLAAMALRSGMNVNSVVAFVSFTRAILKDQAMPVTKPERI